MKESSDQPRPSKTERKRQATHLQNLGRRITELKPKELALVPLPEQILDAVTACQRLRSHEARRRQLQFIGKLMREVDIEPIQQSLAVMDGTSAAARYEFHQLEIWRDRLMGDAAALTDYLDTHPDADRQRLRQQLMKIGNAQDDQTRHTLGRELFRMLREYEK